MLTACQDRNPGDNFAETNAADVRPIEDLARPPEDLRNEVDAASDDSEAAPSSALETIPVAFQGRWAVDRARCGDGQELGLTVTPTLLRFYESEAKVKQIQAAGPRAITVTSDFSGEGQSWEDSQRLSLSADGQMLTIAVKKTATRRVKCS
ncbi:hypothetical protein [Sphingobium boeckii]|uniref:Uncharacterized protein n=1 Tax=Sphingobium boeckii TaxID=1082345 RepID=A0A7W9AEZ3_9SPHN|nr:hypothetical protein [Sphingobium boeckii]MBB5684234.1 hypothetical protein [Sphingobium boeckii]